MRETFESRYIEKYGIKSWIRFSGHEMSFPTGTSLDEIVDKLVYLRETRGFKKYYAKYRGHYLYSLDVTLEDAYLEIYGESYEKIKAKKRTLKQN